MKNVLEFLEGTVSKYPERYAVEDENICFTWRELQEYARKIGSFLCKEGKAGSPVAIVAEKGVFTLAAMLGAAYAGDFYVMIDPSQPDGRMREIFEVLRPELTIVLDEAQQEDIRKIEYNGKIYLLREMLDVPVAQNALDVRRCESSAEDILYGIFTSGSTGKPKCVVVSHRAVIDFITHFIEICRTIGDIKELEYGPGIPVTYFQNQTDMTEMYLSELSDAITNMSWKGKVTLEMGRALTASCGYYLTSVKDIKQNNGRNYCIVDGGIHQIQYDGQIRGMYTPEVQIIGEQEETKEWTVCGSLCTTNDILIQNMEAGDLKTGDVLAFKKAGAYAAMEGMALFLSHELPAVTFFSKADGWELIREKQETYQWNMEDERL